MSRGSGVPGLMARGTLCREVQCIMGNGYKGIPLNRMTDTCENITFPQLRWRVVMKQMVNRILKDPQNQKQYLRTLKW